MEIYLVRHTTPDITKGICYGQADIDVTADFATEQARILEKLTSIIDAEIYSSPLKRCKILAESIGRTVSYDNRLKELDFGDWELKAWDTIPKKEIDPWMKDFVHVKTTGGESYEDLEKRVLDFFAEVTNVDAAKDEEKCVIIVTHAGVMRALLANILRMDLKDSFSISLTYGHVVKIAKNQQGFKIIEGLVTLQKK